MKELFNIFCFFIIAVFIIIIVGGGRMGWEVEDEMENIDSALIFVE